ncbi:hypothetical protein CAPTEDRAFT_211294 [Capitella teleta]|uniref:Uncharacterized protein n=1 Tax=Capitella teleta TaxID=283909 RepID=R7TRE1_CAPTE|nr:hypothetical protein CAPTEDRAFT_211294 [Capitella teleta]|eukprot:ELT93600.1 hypothetical protein CAPTEDRAFT_211294 [Capitella teleta]
MGAKATKEEMQNLATSVGGVRGLSEEDLAGCVASLTDMAHTGIQRSLPEIRINGESLDLQYEEKDRVKSQLKRQLACTNEEPEMGDESQKHLDLMVRLEGQDDSHDWADMRRWLVWCLHDNLDDAETDDDGISLRPSMGSMTGNPLLRRQQHVDFANADRGRRRLQSRRLRPGCSVDSDKDSAQSSFDSGCSTG